MINNYTALYSPLDIEYNQAMSGIYEDLSCKDNDCEVIAAIKNNEISGYWRPVVAVGCPKALRVQAKRLSDIAKVRYLDFCENGELSGFSRYLLEHEYTAKPQYTQVIDLTKSVEELHEGIRKSYTSLINNNEQIHYPKSLEFMRAFHEKERGITRDDSTWDIQQQMVDEGSAFSILTDCACVLIYHNGICAYYACGASTGNSHAAIWKAILTAKKLGCKQFEMGEQIFSGDKKLVNISSFKRGFGGTTKVRLLIEKE